jgi:hypothetical protein
MDRFNLNAQEYLNEIANSSQAAGRPGPSAADDLHLLS